MLLMLKCEREVGFNIFIALSSGDGLANIGYMICELVLCNRKIVLLFYE